MKKLFFILLALTFATLCHSQPSEPSISKVFRASLLKWNGQNWINQVNKFPETMFMTINGNIITLNTETTSKYYTYGEVQINNYDKYDCWSWSAFDINGKSCEVLLKYYWESKIMIAMFMYYKSNIGFEYEMVADN
jgi:hypothetical protein